MVAPAVYGGVMAAGAALSFFSTLKEGDIKSQEALDQAALNDISAARLLELNAINTEETRERSRFTKGQVRTAAAASGFVSDLESLNSVARKAEREIRLNTEETNFKRHQLSLESTQLRKKSKNIKKTSKIKAAGGLLEASGNFLSKG